MSTLPPPQMLGANGAGKEAYEKWHEAIRRINRDSTVPPGKQTLGTKYSAEFEESSELPTWADEYDSARRKDSWVGKSIMYLIGTTAVMGLIKFLNEKFNWL